MRLKVLFFAALSLGLAPCAQAEDQPVDVFKPTANWTADYGDDYCRLIRTFSDGKNELSLALERIRPGDFVRLVFVGDGLKPFRNADEIGYQFAPSGAAAKARYVRTQTADDHLFLGLDPVPLAPVAFTPGAPPPLYDHARDLAAARGVTAIVLSEGLTTPVRLETGSLEAPIGAMQACTDDLVKFWGLDVGKHKAMSAAAVPNPVPNGILPMGMIPFTEFAKFAGGANQVRLMIDASGKPTSCVIYQPTLDKSLNERICGLLMEKATFQPAKDAGGLAMASYWMGPPLLFGPPPPPGFRR